MARITAFLLAALGLAALVWWLAYDTPDPAKGALPDRAADLEGAALLSRAENEVAATRVATEPQENAAEPASSPAAPAALADPTEEELADFAREVPPGTIEGIVLRGRTPVDGGSAWLGAMTTGGLPWGSSAHWDADPDVSRTAIGADGVFRFAGLSPDTYGVGVRALDGATRHVYFELTEAAPSQRIRIVLGAGGVRGHVYDEHGRACAGWQVAVYNYGNTLAGVQVIDGRETDSAGAFEFGGLVGGNYVLSAGPVANRGDPRTQTLYFQLQAGEWKTIDVGAPGNEVIWYGRVLLPRGAPLKLAALTELRVEAGDVRKTAALSPEGSFELRLAAGTYRVSLFAYSRVGGELVELGLVEVAAAGRDHDIVLPHALLSVRATYEGTKQDPRSAVALSTWLEGSGRRRTGLRGADGHEYFLALAPGEYVLSSQPPILGAASGKLPVQIREADDEVELDIVVGDP